MRHPLRLTNSEMKSFRRCRRQWYLGTYRGLAKDAGPRFNTAISIGLRTHDALAIHYSGGDALEYLDRSLEVDKERHPEHAQDIDREADLVRAMIEGYLQWLEETGADRGLEVVSAEGQVEVPLYDDVTLLSKIDARVVHRERADIRLALEHKSCGDLSAPLPFLQIDTQLLTEHLVEYLKLKQEGHEGESAKGVIYNMLRKVKRSAKAKPPFYGREEVSHNVHELEKHWMHVVSVAKQIRQAEQELDDGASHHLVCEPNPTRDCRWDCPFFHLCSHLDDGSAVEEDIARDFKVHDPLERYGQDVGTMH